MSNLVALLDVHEQDKIRCQLSFGQTLLQLSTDVDRHNCTVPNKYDVLLLTYLVCWYVHALLTLVLVAFAMFYAKWLFVRSLSAHFFLIQVFSLALQLHRLLLLDFVVKHRFVEFLRPIDCVAINSFWFIIGHLFLCKLLFWSRLTVSLFDILICLTRLLYLLYSLCPKVTKLTSNRFRPPMLYHRRPIANALSVCLPRCIL